MNSNSIDINIVKNIALMAGQKIMEIYSRNFEIEFKDDKSPLTEADKAANDIITSELKKNFPELPILSEEEQSAHDFENRKTWKTFWMVDPLDGTKEFIKKNGEFTVNIALIVENSPELGVVYAPDKDWLYYADKKGSFHQKEGAMPQKMAQKAPANQGALRVVGSRSHSSDEFKAFLDNLREKTPDIELVPMGSSLKLCLVAEGKADIYPRLGPTSEWDTAAAHAIVHFAGKNVVNFNTGEELTYNKKNLLNDWFIVR